MADHDCIDCIHDTRTHGDWLGYVRHELSNYRICLFFMDRSRDYEGKRNENTDRRRSSTDFRKPRGSCGVALSIGFVIFLFKGDAHITVNSIVVSDPSSKVDRARGGVA